MKYYIVGCDLAGEYLAGYFKDRQSAEGWIDASIGPSSYRIIESRVPPHI